MQGTYAHFGLLTMVIVNSKKEASGVAVSVGTNSVSTHTPVGRPSQGYSATPCAVQADQVPGLMGSPTMYLILALLLIEEGSLSFIL